MMRMCVIWCAGVSIVFSSRSLLRCASTVLVARWCVYGTGYVPGFFVVCLVAVLFAWCLCCVPGVCVVCLVSVLCAWFLCCVPGSCDLCLVPVQCGWFLC